MGRERQGGKGREESGGRGGNGTGRGGECELINPTFTTAFIRCFHTFFISATCFYVFLRSPNLLFYVFMHLCLNLYDVE